MEDNKYPVIRLAGGFSVIVRCPRCGDEHKVGIRAVAEARQLDNDGPVMCPKCHNSRLGNHKLDHRPDCDTPVIL